jgi:exosome complex component RRP46
MAKQPPEIDLRILRNADGSASYTAPNGLNSVMVGVNYPVEVPYRSDEIPESTLIEVNLRPVNGTAMIKERHVEHLVKRTLQTITRLEAAPRMMLQVTLQVTGTEVDETLPGGMKEGGQGETYLPVLASGINAAVIGCLNAGLQMRQVAAAVLIGIGRDGTCLVSPRVQERKSCRSLHVFAVDGTGGVILIESEGAFKMTDLSRGLERARLLVLGGDTGDTDLLSLLRRKIEEIAEG